MQKPDPQTTYRAREIDHCINLIEALGPEVAWSFGTITNDRHMSYPPGVGISVLINGPGTNEHPKPITVYEKHGSSFIEATERAIVRFKRRQAGEGWA